MSDGWRPLSGPAVAAARAAMLVRCRQYFSDSDVLEVDTPILSRFAVTDPNIDAISARAGQADLYLQTSPEYRMKRMLAAGFGDIYQVCKVFRDGETGRHHLPEFTMVEWYRLDFELRQIVDDTLAFIAVALDRPALAATAVVVDYRDSLAAAIGLDPSDAPVAALAARAGADEQLADSLGDDRDAWLDLLFADCVAGTFPDDRLTVVQHYPTSQAALARICPDDDEVADRFEVYCGALELANGFVELTDATEQLARFERDRAIRRARSATVHDIDPRFIGALEAGLPDCAGVAVGFDRLLKLHQGTPDIAAISSFAVME